MFDYHAIKPEEMTACMRLKIEEKIYVPHSPPLEGQLVYNNHF